MAQEFCQDLTIWRYAITLTGMTTTPERRTATLSELVAQEIDSVRGRKRWSQAQLARAIGKTEMWVSLRLRGKQPIDMNDLALIARALDVGVHELLPPPDAARKAASDSEPNVPLDHPSPFGPQRRDPSRPPGTTGPRQRRPQPVRHAA